MKSPENVLKEYKDGIEQAYIKAKQEGNHKDDAELNRQLIIFQSAIRMLNLTFIKNGNKYRRKTM